VCASLAPLLAQGISDAHPDPVVIKQFLRDAISHKVALFALNKITGPPWQTVVWPGAIEDIDDAVDQALWLNQRFAHIYVNLNPLLPWVESIVTQERTKGDKLASVSDDMTARRTRLLIDVDAKSVPKSIAYDQALAILARLGEPLAFTNSGNGYGLIYKVNLPNDAQSTARVKAFLKSSAKDFPCVDTSCSNPARWTRLIGTTNVDKGGNHIASGLLPCL